RLAPNPHITLTADNEWNRLAELGINRANEATHLIGTELRLALNPRVQLISFFLYSTTTNQPALNSRFVWEYKPLS
ncbi:MAG: hypothetical protein ACFB15_06260, partial [Cyclobacteriaceae bacterium]